MVLLHRSHTSFKFRIYFQMFISTSKSFFYITDIHIYLILETLLYFNYYELVLSFKVSFDNWFNFQDIKYGLSSYKQNCFFLKEKYGQDNYYAQFLSYEIFNKKSFFAVVLWIVPTCSIWLHLFIDAYVKNCIIF